MARRRRHIEDDGLPLDEEAQQEVIDTLELDAIKQEQFFRTLFAIVILVPTPMFLLLEIARRHATLSLSGLISSIGSAYALKYSKRPVALASATLAALVALQGIVKFWPRGSDLVVWCIPAAGAATCLVLGYWFNQVENEISRLQAARYHLRGA